MRTALTRAVLTAGLLAGLAAGSLAADLTGTVRARRDQRLDALARVTVIAQTADGSGVLASTKTDGEGKYAFRNLPLPRVALTARRAGFYTYSAGGHADRQIVLDCSAQQDCLGVDFEMRQGAVITGRVVDELGEPVQAIQVHAQAADEDKSSRERRRGGSMSDDRGMFRVAGLDPGSYRLNTEDNQRRGPGRERSEASLEITVGDGEQLHGIELVLREPAAEPVETFSVSGRVTGVDLPSEGMAFISAREQRFGGNASVSEDGTFSIPALRAGQYQFRYQVQPSPGNRRGMIDSVLLGSREIRADVSGLVLSPVPPTGLDGRLVIESGERDEIMSVSLMNSERQFGVGLSAEAPDYTFRREDLDAGQYRISVRGRGFFGNDRLFIREVRVGGKPSESGTISVSEGVIQDVEIILSADFSTIHGRVKAGLEGGELRKGAQYIVGLKEGNRVRTVQADQRGRFSFDKVAPGDYKIGAWDDMSRGRINQDKAWEEAGSAVREFPVEAGSDIEIDLTAVRQ
jgi:hypothetical protein